MSAQPTEALHAKRVRLTLEQQPNAVLIPSAVIGDNQGQKFVLKVGEGDKAETHAIEPGPTYGTQTLVLSGVRSGDRIITDNLQKLRDGVPVEPKAEGETPVAEAEPAS